jgi:hypothetical protein
MGRLTRCTPLAAALVAAVGAPQAFAQKKDGPADDRPQRCIALPNLERTDVLDNRTILFHMRNGQIYLNHLSRECPGLAREKRFMYSPTSTQLCEIDAVTVIEKWGFGFTRGFTCSLGEFHPLAKSEFESLMQTQTTQTQPTQTRGPESQRAAAASAGKTGAAGSERAAGGERAVGRERAAGGLAGAGDAALGGAARGGSADGDAATLGGPTINTLRPTGGVNLSRGGATSPSR